MFFEKDVDRTSAKDGCSEVACGTCTVLVDGKAVKACDENGILTAMKAVIIADTGAYASLGGPVLDRACTHAAGPYNYQNVDILDSRNQKERLEIRETLFETRKW